MYSTRETLVPCGSELFYPDVLFCDVLFTCGAQCSAVVLFYGVLLYCDTMCSCVHVLHCPVIRGAVATGGCGETQIDSATGHEPSIPAGLYTRLHEVTAVF